MREKGILNLIAIVLIVFSALLLVIITGGVTNYADEIKIIWYWIIGIIVVAGIVCLILVNTEKKD